MVGELSFDTVLGLCRDQHRRIVLATLAAEQRPLTLNDLTKAVLKHNHQLPATEISTEVFTHVQCSLHHLHLPKLTAAGVVNYDTERYLVEPTEQFEHLDPYLSEILAADPDLEQPLEL